jgi:NADH-quinone oxidoreductase subunit E
MMKNKAQIDAVINKFIGKKGALIPLLQEVQKIYNYLPKDAMRYVSERTGVKIADIYGVATFYSMFRLKPQGKHIVRVCKGTACHVSGANSILNAIRMNLKLIDEQDTTEDGLFTVMEVACLGCCSLAPVIMINDSTFGKLTSDSVGEVLKKFN